jgi:hypothetical protein
MRRLTMRLRDTGLRRPKTKAVDPDHRSPCDAFARSRLRHPHRAGVAGTRLCEDHHDLHSCHGKGCDGRKKSLGPLALKDFPHPAASPAIP